MTYIGNSEPQPLSVGGKQISRRPGKSWEDAKDQVQHTTPQALLVVGDMALSAQVSSRLPLGYYEHPTRTIQQLAQQLNRVR